MADDSPDAFEAFARAAHAVRDTGGNLAKAELVAAHLATLDGDALAQAAVCYTGRPFPLADARTLRVGRAIIADAARALLPWDDVVLSACQRVVGDAGELYGLLFALDPPADASRPAQSVLSSFGAEAAVDEGGLSLEAVAAVFDAMASTRQSAQRQALVERAWRRLTPLGIRYFTKIMTGGMRVGLAESSVEDAIARAFDRPVAAVRHANMLSGDIGQVAQLARRDALTSARFRLFHPLQFMLATPVDPNDQERVIDDPAAFIIEEKFDGIRAQVHIADGRAVIYSRTLSEAAEFPELVRAALRIPGEFVLDGEIVAWQEGRVLPFGQLQRRLGRDRVDAALAHDVPVRFIAYDLLYQNGEEVYAWPFERRRELLEAIPFQPPFALSAARPLVDLADIDDAFQAARDAGNEGLVLKRKDSPYRFGKRGCQWFKIKRPFATLDVVITAAEGGHGKRAGWLSDLTFAVRSADTDDLLNIGKAYSGLTDVEIQALTRRLRGITRERYANVHLVEPIIVLEVAFDGVQESARHKSGYALRFPRIVRMRPDLTVNDIDTLDVVRELARKSMGESLTPAPPDRGGLTRV